MLGRAVAAVNVAMKILPVVGLTVLVVAASAAAQSVSGVRGFNGGVAPLFNLVGPGNLSIDTQGTQGYIYNFGNNFESYNFRNPATGQAWSGAIMTLGPQLSVGLIQGANQVGSPVVFPPVPREAGPLLPIQSGLLEDIP
ncbi:MAG: hypothetical protein AABZ34_07185 [Nitrospirota bacterium]